MKILIGYDGSNSAKDALKLAEDRAAAFNATVDVITSMVEANNDERMYGRPSSVWNMRKHCWRKITFNVKPICLFAAFRLVTI
jgi:hypothetical protein